jgi:integrase
VHDLRHSFAVGRLLRWYRDGHNPTDKLVKLSTFMGHVDPASTAVYLTVTADLLEAAGQRFERFAAPFSRGGRP